MRSIDELIRSATVPAVLREAAYRPLFRLTPATQHEEMYRWLGNQRAGGAAPRTVHSRQVELHDVTITRTEYAEDFTVTGEQLAQLKVIGTKIRMQIERDLGAW